MRSMIEGQSMTATARLFTLGKAQAVRIPARFRMQAEEVEITQEGGALVLRPKHRTAADLFAAIRAKHGAVALERPAQGKQRPVAALDLPRGK